MSAQGGQGEWRPDPQGKHELRWWDGTTWSDQVADGGVVSTDPLTSPGSGATVAIPTATPPPAPGTPAGAPPPIGVPVAGSPAPPPGAPVPGGATPPPGAPGGGGAPRPPGAPGAPGGAPGGGSLPPGAPSYVPPSSSGSGGVPPWVWIVGGVVGLIILVVIIASLAGGGDSGLGAGDCTDDSLRNLDDVETVDCDEEHDIEVFGTFELEDDDDLPDEDEIFEEVSDECVDLFEEYVGTDIEESDYLADYRAPDEDEWEDDGEREVLCYISGTRDGEDLEGSAEGSED